MEIHIKKGRDGRSTLTCVRADGTRTWSKLHPFFPVHDLTHCAVESVLGFEQAFFGLIAAGDDIGAFEQRGAAARLPGQALWAEHIVGLLDIERAQGELLRADEVNAMLMTKLDEQGLERLRPLTDAELNRIRDLRDALAARWYAVAPGDTLAVGFPAVAEAVSRE